MSLSRNIRIYLFSLLVLFIYCNNSLTYKELAKYTSINHNNESYFISDPNSILTRNQKAVLKLRMEDIFQNLNISVHVYIVNKFNLNDITVDSAQIDEDEFDLNANATKDNNTVDDVLDRKIKVYVKELINLNKVKKASSMTIIMSIEDIEIQLRFGKEVSAIMQEGEFRNLVEFKKERIEKKEYFTAIDHILLNFINNHKPKTFMQRMEKYINILSEVVVFIAMAYSLVYLGGPSNPVGVDNSATTTTQAKKGKKGNEIVEPTNLMEKKNQ